MVNDKGALTQEGIRSLASTLRQSDDSLDPQSIDLVHHAKIRTGHLYVCRSGDREIAIKVADNWSAEQAQATLEELARTGQVLREASEMRAAEAIGWTASPPSVWMGFVSGLDLEMILSDREKLIELNEDGQIAETVRHMGTGLAAYHNEHTGTDSKTGRSHRAVLARRARIIRVPVREIISDTSVPVVSLYQDYSPANMRIDGSGGIFALDPPTQPAYGLPHKDVARFIRGMARGLSRPTWHGHEDSARRALLHLGERFLDGYNARVGEKLEGADDQWLMLLYETLRRWQRVGNQIMARNFRGARRSVQRALEMRRRLIMDAEHIFFDHIQTEV